MEPPPKPSSTQLFQVYLRLRPPPSSLVQVTPQSLYPLLTPPERYLTVEEPTRDSDHGMPTHITLNPPSDSRKRAVEKFAFTKVFEEEATQLDLFQGAGVVPLIGGVLGDGRDGLLATLGVTGSGKVCSERRGQGSQRLYADGSVESYYPGLQVSAGSHADGTGGSVPLSWFYDPAPVYELDARLYISRRGRIRGPDTRRVQLPGWSLW